MIKQDVSHVCISFTIYHPTRTPCTHMFTIKQPKRFSHTHNKKLEQEANDRHALEWDQDKNQLSTSMTRGNRKKSIMEKNDTYNPTPFRKKKKLVLCAVARRFIYRLTVMFRNSNQFNDMFNISVLRILIGEDDFACSMDVSEVSDCYMHCLSVNSCPSALR